MCYRQGGADRGLNPWGETTHRTFSKHPFDKTELMCSDVVSSIIGGTYPLLFSPLLSHGYASDHAALPWILLVKHT